MTLREKRPRQDSRHGLIPAARNPVALAGIALAVVASALTAYSFWRLGRAPGDMLVITDYVATVRENQTIRYGYGGGAEPDASQRASAQSHPDVLFQSKAMSGDCFSITKRMGQYLVAGVEDDISVNGARSPKGMEVDLSDEDRLRTIGQYGGASFTAHLDEQPDQVRLSLNSPLYNHLDSDTTRLTFGPVGEAVVAPVDELFVRTVVEGSTSETYILEKTDGGFRVRPEPSKLISALAKGGDQKPQEASIDEGTQVPPIGTVRLRFRRQAPSSLWGMNTQKIFGIKFLLIVLICAFVFGWLSPPLNGTQVRFPHGALLFGSVTLFAAVGVTLTARDYSLPPFNQGRFTEYSSWLLYSAILLYFLRVPLEEFRQFRWVLSFPGFLIIFALLHRPFDGLLSLPPLMSWFLFTAFYLAAAFGLNWSMRFLRALLEVAARGDWRRTLLLLTPVVLVEVYCALVGGREALFIREARIHLPTLFLPIFVMVTALIVTTIEGNPASRDADQRRALTAILAAVFLYYLSSHFDHGGTAILGAGVLVTAWVASRETRPVAVTVVTAGLLIAAVLVAVFFHQARFELAWGGEEGAVRFFDEAVNLRTARDMARAGGLTGLYDQLNVPSSVAMNIHNDLAAAYLAGFFGFAGLLLVALSYALFYSLLLKGTLGLMVPHGGGKQGAVAVTAGPPKPTLRRSKPEQGQVGAAPREPVRHVVAAYAASTVIVFCLQTFWVLSATLNRWVPISGLDLQPVSASVISVLGFVGMLLGSVALAHNISHSTTGKGGPGATPVSSLGRPPRPVMRRYGKPQAT
jgi:hypothetical protein